MNLGTRNPRRTRTRTAVRLGELLPLLAVLAAGGAGGACGKGAGGPGGGPGGPGGMAMPVPVATVTEAPLRDSSEYVATLKSRHLTNVQPQVEGVITRILVKSGDRVTAGAPLMQIDPEKQRATVHSQEATRALKLAALNYAKQQRQRMASLYQGGAVSKQQLDEAESALAQAQADYDAVGAQVKEQEVELAYYRVAAPAAGVVGDIPVRTGDRVTTSTLLTTIDQNDALEVYISVPIEHAKDLRLSLPVEVLGGDGSMLASTQINFIAPQVDNQTQEVLVKAPVPNGPRGFRSEQFVRARLIWNTHPGVVVPLLAVSRVNGQYFVFVAEPGGPPGPPGGGAGGPGGGEGGGGEKGGDANGGGAKGGGEAGAGAGPGGPGAQGGPGAAPHLVAHQRPITVGDVVGNDYVVLSGLKPGERVVSGGVQKLVDGMPIMEMPSGPGGPPGGAPGPGGPGGPGGGSSGAGSAGGSGGDSGGSSHG